ncbi:hypothetical protein ACTMTJ_20945 [Phytohabitans sp. LJ34]|uniref:hypothetical protein n=1 Tax=Phytohabitans sp. LJ34 TaxID=3452217 RepID=UPI003F8A1745
MNKTILVAAAAVALAGLATGCARANASASKPTGSVHELVAVAGHGAHNNYTPLTSPRDAVGQGDLIVEGTLVEVGDGIQVTYPANAALTEREADDYATFVVAVEKVLDGDAGRVVDGKVYIAVPVGGGATTERLTALNPQATIVAVLDDISTWRPVPEATVVRPANIPAGVPLYYAYTDGMWLQGTQDNQMYAIDAEHDELAPAWGGVSDVEGYSGKIEEAAS